MNLPCILIEEVDQRRHPRPAETCLGDLRIADADHESLDRQLHDVIKGQKGGREGDLRGRLRRWQGIEIADLLWRVQRYGDRLVAGVHRATAIQFPVAAKTHAVRAALPGDNIIEMKAATQQPGGPGIPDKQVWIDGNGGSSDAEAIGTVRLARG